LIDVLLVFEFAWIESLKLSKFSRLGKFKKKLLRKKLKFKLVLIIK